MDERIDAEKLIREKIGLWLIAQNVSYVLLKSRIDNDIYWYWFKAYILSYE